MISNLPKDIYSEYLLATHSYSTTEKNQKLRVRYIAKDYLSQEHSNMVTEYLSSFYYLYSVTAKEEESDRRAFSFSFLQMITNSCTLHQR